MKTLIKSKHLLPLAFLLGALGFLLRITLYDAAMEPGNLLLRGHPAGVGMVLVIPAVLILAALGVRGLDGSPAYKHNFSPSVPAAAGNLAAAAGLLATVLTPDSAAPGLPGLVWKVLGFLAAGALVAAARCRYLGKAPSFFCHLGLCLFLLSHLVSHYQAWCATPQTLDYLFELLGSCALMIFAYHCAAFSAGMGKRRMQLATGLCSVALCLTALGVSGYRWLNLGGLIFAATNLCALTPVPKAEEKGDMAP